MLLIIYRCFISAIFSADFGPGKNSSESLLIFLPPMNVSIDPKELAKIQSVRVERGTEQKFLSDDFIAFESEAPAANSTIELTSEQRQAEKQRKRGNVRKVLSWNAPWSGKRPKYSKDALECLTEEIVDFSNYVAATEEERFSREEAIGRLAACVEGVWGHAQVVCFGSFDSQLYLPSSDLDVVVLLDASNENNSKDPMRDDHAKPPLKKLAKALEKAGIPRPESVQVITKARVPIIKYIDAITDFPVDVCFNVSSGLEAATFMRSMLQKYPAVRPLTLLLKQFLKMRSLNDVFVGGLGSYSIMCLVISFCQVHPLLQTGMIQAVPNLGVLLMEFLELYGRNFNYLAVGIGCRKGGYFSKQERGWYQESRPHLLSIEDPQNEENDISKGSFAIGPTRQAFEHAFNILKCAVLEYEEHQYQSRKQRSHSKSFVGGKNIPSILGSIISIDDELLRHRYYIQQTTNL